MAVYEEKGRGTRSSEVNVRLWRSMFPKAMIVIQKLDELLVAN